MELHNSEGGTFFKCFFCGAQETKVRTLKRCSGCQLVTYCSRDCQKDDRIFHKPVCEEFPIVNGRNVLHSTGPWEEHIAALRKRAAQLPDAKDIAMPIFLNPKVCHTCKESKPVLLKLCKCAWVLYCSETCANADKLHKTSCSFLGKLAEKCSIHTMQMSYPASFWNILQRTDEVGQNHCHPEELTKIDMHIITKTAYFDALSWEYLFHQLPNLEELNLVFLIQGMAYNPSFDRCEMLTRLECEKCKSNNRIITYSVHQKPYHMFFSSPEYTEPDFVVAFGIPYANNDIHSELSYRNMTYCFHSILVMMDSSKDLLIKGIRDVKAAQPSSTVLWPPERNPSRGFGSNVSELEFNADASNVKYYISSCYTSSYPWSDTDSESE